MGHKKRILIIDDDQELVEAVTSALEEVGVYEVKGETKGNQGILTARSYQPDLILLDVMMPDMSGNDVARELMDGQSTKHIPIAYFTVIVCKDEVELNGGVIGGHRFISKPATVDELVRSIEETIGA